MVNTQALFSSNEVVDHILSEENIRLIQRSITNEIKHFFRKRVVVVPAEDIRANLLHVFDRWGQNTITVDEVNTRVTKMLVDEFRNTHTQRLINANYMNNEKSFIEGSDRKTLMNVRTNRRARTVQYQTTF